MGVGGGKLPRDELKGRYMGLLVWAKRSEKSGEIMAWGKGEPDPTIGQSGGKIEVLSPI